MSRPTDDEIVLSWDPFAGDETGYRQLRNRMVVTRKPCECHWCGLPIRVGSRVRSLTEAFDGEIQTTRFCPDCCAAVVASWDWPGDVDGDDVGVDDDLPPIERRADLARGAP